VDSGESYVPRGCEDGSREILDKRNSACAPIEVGDYLQGHLHAVMARKINAGQHTGAAIAGNYSNLVDDELNCLLDFLGAHGLGVFRRLQDIIGNCLYFRPKDVLIICQVLGDGGIQCAHEISQDTLFIELRVGRTLLA
jgi:hypothetical protein